jgi:uncharacterized protein (TIGR01244 family)
MRSRWKNVLSAAALLAVCILVAAQAKGPETYGISAAAFPEPGVMTAGQPTGEQVQLLAEDGYKTILDLRTPAEPRGFDEIEAARQNGLAYVNVPVSLATLDQATIDLFLAAMKKAQKPVIIHCSTADRVGALWYAWLILEKGKSTAAALDRAKAAGLRSPELTEKIKKLVAERPSSPRPSAPKGR